MWAVNQIIREGLGGIETRLTRIERLLYQIIAKGNLMSVDLTKLAAEVANNTSVTASVEALIANLAAQIAAIPVSTDPITQAALDALTATLSANDTSIASAVTANTPAAPAPTKAS